MANVQQMAMRELAKREAARRGLQVGGGAAVLGLGSEEAEAAPIWKEGKRIIEAWHGSPHKFDKFSMDQIGTGEGAQAYGHGLYFADAEDVAKGYRDDLGLKVPAFDGVPARTTAETVAYDILNKWDPEIAPRVLQEQIDSGVYKGASPEYIQGLKDALQENLHKTPGHAVQGSLYRAHLDVDPDTLLDWDKPLSEQSEAVQRAVERVIAKHPPESDYWLNKPSLADKEYWTGEHIYYALGKEAKARGIGKDASRRVNTPQRREWATNELLQEGIPGIRYLDGDSRIVNDQAIALVQGQGSREAALDLARRRLDATQAGDSQGRAHWQRMVSELDKPESSNYVMFSDEPISIQERGRADPRLLAGVAGATAAPLIAAGMAPQDVQAALQGQGLRGGVDLATSAIADTGQMLFEGGAKFGSALFDQETPTELVNDRWYTPQSDVAKGLGYLTEPLVGAVMDYKPVFRDQTIGEELSGMVDTYTGTVRPWLDENIGEYGRRLGESGAVLGGLLYGAR